jgi:hypothetical protein
MGITAFDCKSMIRAERGGRLRPVRAVQRAVLDGNAKVFGRDCVRRVEVCDGARDFQNAVVRAGGKPEARDCSFEQLFAFGVDRAVLADESGRHLSVRVDAFFAREAFGLAGARITRWRIAAEPSMTASPRSSLYFTAGTSMWMSMRSSSGPEIFET